MALFEQLALKKKLDKYHPLTFTKLNRKRFQITPQKWPSYGVVATLKSKKKPRLQRLVLGIQLKTLSLFDLQNL